MTEKDLSLNNRRKIGSNESQNKQITSETNNSKVSKQLFLVPALLGGNLLLSAKAAFDAPNTQHWTLNALNMLKIALTQSDCCTVYIECTNEKYSNTHQKLNSVCSLNTIFWQSVQDENLVVEIQGRQYTKYGEVWESHGRVREVNGIVQNHN